MAWRGRPRHPGILTTREWQALELLREGRSNPEIAARMGISMAGARYHVSEILGKLGVTSRLDAARWQPDGDEPAYGDATLELLGSSKPSGKRDRHMLPAHDASEYNRCVDNRPIGMFDSGVGGLTIWRATKKLLPNESLVFLADSGHVPYGEKTPDEIRDLAARIVRFLRTLDVKLVVAACNTATVHAIAHLRSTFPDLPFVGVVPVVKTLARRTRTGTIAVLSTPGTSKSPYLAALIEQFAPGKRVVNVGCDGLEDLVEAGDIRTRRTTALLERHLAPVRCSDADVVGLGCTHYPFLRGRIKRLLGPGVTVYDPSRPVARRVRQLLEQAGAFAANGAPSYRFYTTGDVDQFAVVASKLLRFSVKDVGHAKI